MGANNSRRYQIESGEEQIARLIDDMQITTKEILFSNMQSVWIVTQER